MHVLVTADTVGGVWIYTRELVAGLARSGVRVTLVSFGGIPKPAQTAWLEGFPGSIFIPPAFAWSGCRMRSRTSATPANTCVAHGEHAPMCFTSTSSATERWILRCPSWWWRTAMW